MKAGVTSSVVAHAAVLVVAIVGLGSARPFEPDVVESIAVELVPISEFTNIRAGSLDSEVVETETPTIAKSETPAEIAQPTGNTEEDQVTPQETATVTPAPVVNTAPEPVPEVQPEPEPEPVPEPVPEPEPVAEPEPAPEPVPEEIAPPAEIAAPIVTPEPAEIAPRPAVHTAALDQMRADFKKEQADKKKKAAEEKKKKEEEAKRVAQAKQQADKQAREADLASIIENDEKSRGATTGAGGTPTLGKNTGTSATLSQNEMARLIEHVKSCISVPPGAIEEGATAQIRFRLDRSYQVVGAPQIVAMTGEMTGQTYAGAASRAVVRCQSVDGGYAFLPAEKYDGADGWNEVDVTFRANDTF
ncbi:MAG: hypothetical protein ABIO40_10660 [Devosia sp.]